MPSKKYPNMTREEMIELFEKNDHSWFLVAKALGVAPSWVFFRRKALNVPELETKKRRRVYKSVLDSYHDQIVELAAQGLNTKEIKAELDLPTKPEQVRRYMKKHNIPLLAKQGAQPGEKNGSWNGGKTVDKGGYILVRRPDHPNANSSGYIREHRLVMESMIGRYLTSEEVVHHINGITDDNRPENLQLFESNAEHLHATLTKHRDDDNEETIVNGKDDKNK